MVNFTLSNIGQMMDKLSIRKQISALRKSEEQEHLQRVSRCIVEKLMSLEVYKQAQRLFSYAALPLEIQTAYLHEKAKEEGKQVAYPLIGPEVGEMAFYEVSHLEDLEEHIYKHLVIKDPNPKKHRLVVPKPGDVMVVPGLAFDRKGGRVGYGGGFYDRYLEKYPFIYTIGVGQSFQLLEEVPKEETDRLLQQLLISDKTWGCEEIRVY